MRRTLFLLLTTIVLFSCKTNKQKTLTGTWHAISLESKEMDSVLTQGQLFIDTVGKNTNAAADIQLYGTVNMDSLKHVLQSQLDSVKLMQAEAVKGTVFQFRKDSVAILTFSGKTDSMKWHLDTDTSITLSPLGGIGSIEEIRMEIIAVSDTAMRLRFRESGATSIVTFHPEK